MLIQKEAQEVQGVPFLKAGSGVAKGIQSYTIKTCIQKYIYEPLVRSLLMFSFC